VFTCEPYEGEFRQQTGNMELIFGMPFKDSRYYNIFLVNVLSKLVKKTQAEWIFFDQPWFGWMMWMLKLTTRKKIFVRSNNIEYLRFRSMGKWFWQMLYVYEKWTYRAADLVLFVTENERQKAIYEFDLDPNRTLLAPYGVELDKAPLKSNASEIAALKQELGIAADEKMILFFSTLSYFPNYEAVGFIADNIYPLLKQKEGFRFKIVLCGKGLPADVKQKIDNKPEIVYLGFVDDIGLYIDAADIMINPILSGGGVKTKAIDTLARNQRVLSTRNGADGIDPAVCADNLVIVEDYDWQAFADAIEKLAGKPASIPQAFYNHYGWPGIIDNVTRKLESLTQKQHGK
jgi:polysaccharide biosynthesis protein PslH